MELQKCISSTFNEVQLLDNQFYEFSCIFALVNFMSVTALEK